MKKKILRSVELSPKGRFLSKLYSLSQMYLKDEGWNKSVASNMSIDCKGDPVPWFTYSSMQFFKERIKKEHSVFEYGSGNSTLWFSKHAGKIVSIENDNGWYSQMKSEFSKASNIVCKLKDMNTGEYENEILNYNHKFDVVIIDGVNRVDCCLNSLAALKDDGVIIWDNSDRVEYNEGYKFLLLSGFRRIDFWGIGPINPYLWCTSVFYKSNNCLGI